MKKILPWLLIPVFTAVSAIAQESATQQQLDKLSGQLEDHAGNVELQRKRIDALEKEVNELREKVNTPQVNDSASRDDLKKLAAQVQEIDRKRQEDRELILKEIEKIGKAAAAAPIPVPTSHKATSAPKPPADDPGPAAGPQNGYEYLIKDGDNLGLIIKWYQAKGVKVTKRQIIAANPKMNPDVLIPGKKIFIPDANAK